MIQNKSCYLCTMSQQPLSELPMYIRLIVAIGYIPSPVSLIHPAAPILSKELVEMLLLLWPASGTVALHCRRVSDIIPAIHTHRWVYTLHIFWLLSLHQERRRMTIQLCIHVFVGGAYSSGTRYVEHTRIWGILLFDRLPIL